MSAISDIVDRLRGLQVDALLGLRPPYPPVAVEFDREEAVLVRVKHKRRGKPLLEAHAVRSVPTDCIPASIFQQPAGANTELVGQLRELFEVTGTRPGRVSLVLPDNLAKVSLLTLPERPASQRQLDELVRSKMRRAVPFRLEEAKISYQLLPAEGRQVGVLVLLVRKNLVDRFEQALGALGARVGLIDISTPNLINLYRPRLAAACRDGKDVALLNCASNYFSLVIVRNERLIFFRCKTFSTESRPTNGSNGFLVREVASSFSYYREKLAGQGVEHVFVRGLHAPFEEIASKLDGLELPQVESIDPTVDLELPPGERIDARMAQRIAPALGAAAGRLR